MTFQVIYFTFIGVTLFACLARFRRSRLEHVIVLSYLLLNLTVSVVAILIVKSGSDNNLFLFHFYTPIEYALFAWLYFTSFETKSIRKFILFSVPTFAATSVFVSLLIQPITSNNSLMVMLESLVIVVLAILFFREVIVLQRVPMLQRYPLFWLNTGLLFYFVGSIFFEGVSNYSLEISNDLARRVYFVSFVFKYLLFILFIVSFYCTSIFPLRKEQT
jgi:hypothetical protein